MWALMRTVSCQRWTMERDWDILGILRQLGALGSSLEVPAQPCKCQPIVSGLCEHPEQAVLWQFPSLIPDLGKDESHGSYGMSVRGSILGPLGLGNSGAGSVFKPPYLGRCAL